MADKRLLMGQVNALAAMLQGIGQQRAQQSQARAQMSMQKKRLEMDAEDMKRRAEYNKAVLADMKAASDLREFQHQEYLSGQEGQAATAGSFAQPGGVEGMRSTGVETQWEEMYASMTPEQQANKAYVTSAFNALGGVAAMRKDMPTPTEIASDVEAYAKLSLGGTELALPEYMQQYAPNIEFMAGEYKEEMGREDIEWDFGMQDKAFSRGTMAGFDESLKIDEIPYPEGLEPGYEQFFYAGVRSTREGLKSGRRGVGGGVGPDPYTRKSNAKRYVDGLLLSGGDPTDDDWIAAYGKVPTEDEVLDLIGELKARRKEELTGIVDD